MDLTFLLSKRRYRRLGVALCAALLVHLGLVLTGNWGILLFSAPSNQDRVITLTLQNTPYEGLKETNDVDDTVNDAKLGAPSTVKPQPRISEDEFGRETGPKIESVSKEMVKPSKQEQRNSPPTPTAPTPNSSHSSIVAETSPSLLELVSTKFESETKVAKRQKVVEQNSKPQERDFEELKASEVKMLTKKLKRWTSRVQKNDELPELEQWDEDGQPYRAIFKPRPAENDMQTDELVIEIATDRDGKKLTTSLRLKKLAFSNFAQFVHQWDDEVSIHDDEMNGRFHSNTKFHIVADREASPLFHGKVTTASFFVDIDGHVPRKKMFLAGLETGVKRIAMPKPSLVFDEVHDEKRPNSRLIAKSSRIIFNSDGSYCVQTYNEIGVMRRYEIGEQPLYLLAAPGAVLSVSGVLNGVVAMYSPKRIIIEGSIEYASTDDIALGGDFLGLISGRSVVVANRKAVTDGDLNVQAAIYAKNRFAVSQLRGRPMGTLNILGSVSAGTITATEPRYATNIVFDTRLEKLRPPGFPVTDRYELMASQNSWQIDDDPYYETFQQDNDQQEAKVAESL